MPSSGRNKIIETILVALISPVLAVIATVISNQRIVDWDQSRLVCKTSCDTLMSTSQNYHKMKDTNCASIANTRFRDFADNAYISTFMVRNTSGSHAVNSLDLEIESRDSPIIFVARNDNTTHGDILGLRPDSSGSQSRLESLDFPPKSKLFMDICTENNTGLSITLTSEAQDYQFARRSIQSIISYNFFPILLSIFALTILAILVIWAS